jgi:hypothetical protein
LTETHPYRWSIADHGASPLGKSLLLTGLKTCIVIAWILVIGLALFFADLGFRSYKTTTIIWCMRKISGSAMIHKSKIDRCVMEQEVNI